MWRHCRHVPNINRDTSRSGPFARLFSPAQEDHHVEDHAKTA